MAVQPSKRAEELRAHIDEQMNDLEEELIDELSIVNKEKEILNNYLVFLKCKDITIDCKKGKYYVKFTNANQVREILELRIGGYK